MGNVAIIAVSIVGIILQSLGLTDESRMVGGLWLILFFSVVVVWDFGKGY